MDDIAKRVATRRPLHSAKEWTGPALFVSMADPPSIAYGAATNAERDRDFTTSLVGPSGRTSVNWSTSIRITSGTVTSNRIT